MVSVVKIDIKIARHPMANLMVKGSFKNIKDIIPPNTASMLNIIAVWVDEVYFEPHLNRKAIRVLNTAKYSMDMIAS